MASEYRLRLLYKEEFHDVFAEHHEHPEFGQLLQRMKVVDSEGESQMDEDQWEAASTSSMALHRRSDIYHVCFCLDIYVAFAFEKF